MKTAKQKTWLIAITLILFCATAFAATPYEQEEVIVKFKPSPLAVQNAAIGLQEIQLFEQELASIYSMNIRGTTYYSQMHVGPGFVYGTVSENKIDELQENERVEYIVKDRKVITFETEATSLEGLASVYQFNQIIQQGFDGEGIKIAVIDSGKPIRSDLEVAGAKDFTGTGVNDSQGHSTAIVSIIRAIAPKAEIHTYKAIVLGEGRASTIMRAIDQAVQDDMDIITLQIGASPTMFDPMKEMVDWAGTQTLLFSSAGNCGAEGPDTACGWTGISSPGNSANAISVGAITQQGYKASFSPINELIKKPDAYALGTNIEVYALTSGKRIVSGNSFSTPIAAAYAADLLSQGINNDLPLQAKKTIFFKGLEDTQAGWDLTTLRGEVYPPNALLIAIEPIIDAIVAIIANNALGILFSISAIIAITFYWKRRT